MPGIPGRLLKQELRKCASGKGQTHWLMEYEESPETSQCIDGALENDRGDMLDDVERGDYSANVVGKKWLSTWKQGP